MIINQELNGEELSNLDFSLKKLSYHSQMIYRNSIFWGWSDGPDVFRSHRISRGKIAGLETEDFCKCRWARGAERWPLRCVIRDRFDRNHPSRDPFLGFPNLEPFECKIFSSFIVPNRQYLMQRIAGWWFGTSILFLHILGIIIPTNIFQRGGPSTNQIRSKKRSQQIGHKIREDLRKDQR